MGENRLPVHGPTGWQQLATAGKARAPPLSPRLQGPLYKAIRQGRSDLVAAVRRQPLKQLRQADAEKLRVRGSPFPVRSDAACMSCLQSHGLVGTVTDWWILYSIVCYIFL